MKERFLDIGAGFGENFIRRAKENPDKRYLVVEPETDIKTVKGILPENLYWITGRIDEESLLPLLDNSIDEVNLDFVFIDLHGRDQERLFPKFFAEAMRVLKKEGSLFIREPKYIVDLLEPVLKDLKLEFSIEPIPPEEAERHSLSVREAYWHFEKGDVQMQPYLIKMSK